MANINFQIEKEEKAEWVKLKKERSWLEYFRDLISNKYEEESE